MRLRFAPAALLLVAASPAVAAGPRSRCLAASLEGQTLVLKDELHAAREKFQECARPACPKLVRRDCVDFLGKVASIMPTIVIGARDPGGRDLVDVRITIDGKPTLERLDGKPLEIDPGTHTLHAEMAGAPAVDQILLVREGERDRLVTVTVGTPPPPPPPTRTVARTVGPSPWTWVLGGVGLAALGATAITGSLGLSQWQTAHDGCAVTHSCSAGDVSNINALYDVAYATAAIGGALVITGIVLFFTTRHTQMETVVMPALRGGTLLVRF